MTPNQNQVFSPSPPPMFELASTSSAVVLSSTLNADEKDGVSLIMVDNERCEPFILVTSKTTPSSLAFSSYPFRSPPRLLLLSLRLRLRSSPLFLYAEMILKNGNGNLNLYRFVMASS